MSVTLRDYVQADAESVDRLAVAAFSQYEKDFKDWRAMAARLGATSKLAGVSQIIVAEENGKIVGAVGYLPPHSPKFEYFKAEWPLIRTLVVDPAARGRGIGRMLADECIARARRDKASEIALHTSPIMQVALPMYQRMGFERFGEAPPILGVPYSIYVKKL